MSLEDIEREKYEKVWADPRYREHSPGERLVEKAIGELGMRHGQSVIDYGCGTGRAVEKFTRAGFITLGIDHAGNCLDPDVLGRFMRACLWDLPAISSDWAFCTDVMEHIPEEKVDEVLTRMRANTGCGAFLQIAFNPDGFGPMLIGEPLHLTLKPANWWTEKLTELWREVETDDHGSQAIFVCR